MITHNEVVEITTTLPTEVHPGNVRIRLGNDQQGGHVAVKQRRGQDTILLHGDTGRIGIGTNRPEKPLHIRAAGADASGSDARLIIENGHGQQWFLNVWRDTNKFSIGRVGVGDDLVIGDNGNVGIGTVDPDSQADLHVSRQGDATIDVESTGPSTSRTRLRSVVSNNRQESQLQFRGELSFVAPLPFDSGGSRALLTLHEDGNLFLTRPADNQATIHLDSNAGDIRLLGADCAEEFDVGDSQILEPGTVLVIEDEDKLHPCSDAYDKRVAGVFSGAGDYNPGIILNKQESPNKRVPLALSGKVYCKVDAQYSAVEVGDLLTTSPTPGHAMKATDPLQAFGSVLGKALRSLKKKQGMVPILVALQ
jgi:hypothetical protein